jgi:hypothetical protein
MEALPQKRNMYILSPEIMKEIDKTEVRDVLMRTYNVITPNEIDKIIANGGAEGQKPVSSYDLNATKVDMGQNGFDPTGYGLEPKEQVAARQRNLNMMALAAHGALGEGAVLAGVKQPTAQQQEAFIYSRSMLPDTSGNKVDVRPIQTVADGSDLKRNWMPSRPGGSIHTSTKTWGNKDAAWQKRRDQMEHDVHPELAQHYKQMDYDFAQKYQQEMNHPYQPQVQPQSQNVTTTTSVSDPSQKPEKPPRRPKNAPTQKAADLGNKGYDQSKVIQAGPHAKGFKTEDPQGKDKGNGPDLSGM